MQKMSSLSVGEKLYRLEQAYDSVLSLINGAHLTPLYGTYYRSEESIVYGKMGFAEFKKFKELSFNRTLFRKKMRGEPSNPKRGSLSTLRTIPCESFKSANKFYYKYDEELTLTFEEMHESVETGNSVLVHIVINFDEKTSVKVQQSAERFKQFKSQISRLTRRALGDRTRGFFVIERCGKEFEIKGDSKTYSALHAHMLLECSASLSKQDIRGLLKKQFRSSMRKIDTAMSVSFEFKAKCIETTGKVRKYKKIDLGLADYLAKRLNFPIVEGCENKSKIGPKLLHYRVRREWRYRQYKALEAEFKKLSFHIVDVPVGFDFEAHLIETINAVKRPPELIKPSREHQARLT
ncbi:hypothetical protein [Alteromonas sp. P256]|uniref:hypothetical protein n=1 Tax=Alteromonas sp. P256 TaxID=3117399 RepID=UPI002FE3E198